MTPQISLTGICAAILTMAGLGFFWLAVLVGLWSYLHNGLTIGIVDTTALLLATTGFFILLRIALDVRSIRAAFD